MPAIRNKSLRFLRAIMIVVMLVLALGSAQSVSVAHADPLPKVALLGSETGVRLTDIVNKVTAAGAGLYTVTNLSGCPLATPTLATLQQYQAVMVWSDCVFNNSTTLGDVLADYVDGGGHVVVAAHVWWPYTASATQTLDIRGRFASGGYNPLTLGTSGIGGPTWSLVADLPTSSLFAGVASFTTQSVDNTNSLAPGATLAAHYGIDNRPAVAFKGNVVALNFFPASSDAQAGFWNSSTNGARLMANALLFRGAALDPESCQDILDANPSAADGDYVIYPNNQMFTVYCNDMAGTPSEYLTLAYTGGGSNFSQMTAGGGISSQLVTHYTKVRLDPVSLLVDINDKTFSSTTGYPGYQVNPWNTVAMDYATGVDCPYPYAQTGRGNIDLRGTPFAVNTTFLTAGWLPSAGSAAFSAADQVVNLQGGGYCGWISPGGTASWLDDADAYILSLQFIGPLPLDTDGDGVADATDNCPAVANASQTNTDGDSLGDACDTDDDGDGVLDVNDAFPLNPAESVDTDGDGIGDNADPDDDNDGVADASDAFPLDAAESVDTDGDGAGNNSDPDDDNDGFLDAADAFPLNPAESVDTDGDGIGNVADTDDDGDGVEDASDAFPLDATESADNDGDGIGNNADTDDDNDGTPDASDAFPFDAGELADSDGDGIGDNADPDDDNDGVLDAADAFPFNPSESVDSDGDGIGDNADTDDDGDGVDDAADAFPLNPAESVDTDSDGIGNNADPDDDNDTVDDASDAFPLNPTESVDTDGDGVGNNTDTDDDGDGVTDAADAFPLDAAESVDSDGDGIGNNADPDDDNDGIADALDAFPLDPFESADMDGDGIGNNTDTDDDGDGVLDVNDAFPLNANESVDTDGDGVGNNADPDDDGDGVNDLTDACSLVSGAGTDADNNGCVDVITDLSGLVQSFNLHKGTQTSLLAKVNSAMAYLNAGNTADAISSLQAFINETRAQRGKKISATQADILIAFAQNVIAGLQ